MWYESLEKNMFIKNMYTEIPHLANVRIAQIKILDEGDRISLVFDMPYFADKPPKKWVGLGCNTAIVQVDFFDIKEVMLKSIDNRYRGSIEIEKDKEGMIIVEVTGSIGAKIRAGVGMIQSIEGYCNQT
ncbi:Imm50 family immunity protein [Desulfosporosinus nitroreducens]|uniref:Imm50 family immunity protein n=1 Tax=Desulfosporosinus nitroreducens TaxID=2018668 RepID=UPI00207CCE8E|nr:Imm50 family immunity protein [Desulfosporosinus nitroreducens]MCO1604047.1 immunity 50 family protein [Desulfosporosinus nitroreducens]